MSTLKNAKTQTWYRCIFKDRVRQSEIARSKQPARASGHERKRLCNIALDLEGVIATWNEVPSRFSAGKVARRSGATAIFFTLTQNAHKRISRRSQQSIDFGRMEYEGWRTRKDADKFLGQLGDHSAVRWSRCASGYAVIVRDLTERQAAAETLRQSDEASD